MAGLTITKSAPIYLQKSEATLIMPFRKHLPRSQYLETLRGAHGRYKWRYYTYRLGFTLRVRPRSKGAMHEPEVEAFQREILQSLQTSHRRAFKGRVVADFLLMTDDPNPPHIQTATKNLMDLFGAPVKSLNTSRRGLAYYDDKQVKALSVRYSVGHESLIAAWFAPYMDFLNDLKLAESLITSSRIRDELEVIWDGPDEDPFDFEDSLKWLRQLETSSSEGRAARNDQNHLKRFLQSSIQEAFLRSASLKLNRLLPLLGRGHPVPLGELPAIRQIRDAMGQQIEELVSSSRIRVQLQSLPTKDGDSAVFRKEVNEAFRRFLKESRIPWQPLLTPVALEVLYKPPRTSLGLPQDLDNLMRTVLPKFHEIFQPPINPLVAIDPQTLSPEMALRFEQLGLKIPKGIRYSVVGYDVFEIPRRLGDATPGFVSVGLASGTEGGGLWRRLDDFFEKVEDLFSDEY